MIAEVMRPEMRGMAIDYLHQTIRELHFVQDVKMKYGDNLVEDVAVADADSGYLWAIPAPQRLQMMESVYYNNRGKYSYERSPSAALAFTEEIGGDIFWYRTGNYIAFAGYGGSQAQISLAWYEFPRRLLYYPANSSRPAIWDEESQQFLYAAAYNIDATTRANALVLTTNWVLSRHKEVVKEGVRAKLYKRSGDIDRAKLAFAAYKQNSAMVYAEASNQTPQYFK